jgi:hypothetical protein
MQSFFMCVIAPQFSQAPFLYFTAREVYRKKKKTSYYSMIDNTAVTLSAPDHKLTPRWKIFLEKLILTQLAKEFLVGFEVLTVVSTKMAVFFWVVVLCSLVEVYQHFRGPCCLHHHRPDDGGSKDL